MHGKPLANGRADSDSEWDEKRRHKRKPVLFMGRLETDTSDEEAIILDLSLGGARLRVPTLAKARQPVTLVIARFGRLNAEVAWCRSGQIGLRFVDRPEHVQRVIGGAIPLVANR
jgi:hypothetical protein